MLVAIPSWLVSFVLHCTVLLTLGFAQYHNELPGDENMVVLVFDTPEAAQREALAMVPTDPLATVTIEALAETGQAPETFGDEDGLLQLPLSADSIADEMVEIAPPTEPLAPFDFGALHAVQLKPRDVHKPAGAAAPVQPIARFCGVEASGQCFVFIIDSSGSMAGLRLKEAKQQVMHAIEHLAPDQRFYVFFFNNYAVNMFEGSQEEGAKIPISATKENIAKVRSWLPKVDAQGGTEPADAAGLALDMHPDAIYLLSDGQLNSNRILDIIAAKQHVAIHTIGFHDLQNRDTLSRIAAQCGGTYRFVAGPAPKAKAKNAVRPTKRSPQSGQGYSAFGLGL